MTPPLPTTSPAAPRPQPTSRRRGAAIMLLATACIVGLSLITGVWNIAYTRNPPTGRSLHVLAIGAGQLVWFTRTAQPDADWSIDGVRRQLPPGFRSQRGAVPLRLLPWREHTNSTLAVSRSIGLPLWCLSIPMLAATIWLWFPVLRGEWRLSRGRCPSCCYSLAGNTTGVCPECGTRIAREMNTRTGNNPA